MPPRVSILLPIRDAAATLEPCLRSITRQTEQSWECIAVDDGSIDGTAGILRRAAARDRRINVVTTPPAGLIAALNLGLTCCAGGLIARMDADDVMHRARIAAQADALDRHPDWAAVGCHVRLFPRRSLSPRLQEYEAWLNGLRTAQDVERDVFVECPVAHPTLMMRGGMAALGYDDRGWPEDYDLVLRARAAGLRLGTVPRRLMAWRNGAGSLSRRDPRYAIERFTACKAHYLAAGLLAGGPEYVLWGYGSTGRALRRALLAHGKHPALVVEVKQGRLGQRIHGAAVVSPEHLPASRGGLPVVVSVARERPRGEIRRALAAMGLLDGVDYVCAA